jgi:hypothetical protein
MVEAKSKTDASESALGVDMDMDDAEVETEAASALGLPPMPSTVPVPVHDALSEVIAEDARESRFQQTHSAQADGEDAEDDAEADEEDSADSEAEAGAGDESFAALVAEDQADDADAFAEVESELANEDAADVDTAEADGSVASIDSALAAEHEDGLVAANPQVADLRKLVDGLQSQLNAGITTPLRTHSTHCSACMLTSLCSADTVPLSAPLLHSQSGG